MREEEGGGRFARRMPPAEVGNPEIPESHIHTFHHGSTLLLENSDGPLQFRPGTGAGGDGSEMRSCRGQLLTLEKFPGSHRSARAERVSNEIDSDAVWRRCPLTSLPPSSLLLEKLVATRIDLFAKIFRDRLRSRESRFEKDRVNNFDGKVFREICSSLTNGNIRSFNDRSR